LAVAITKEHANMEGGTAARQAVQQRIRESLSITARERQRDKIVNRVAGTPR
jgi:hypothetical protein